MSGTNSLTDAQLVDIRRFCGYPVFGSGPGDSTFNRFMASYETLEYRLANITANEASVVVTTYLTNLYTLETAITTASANLGTDQAAVWIRNKTEVRDRMALFDNWRIRLCNFLGVPPGPMFSSSTSSMRLVV